MTEISTPDAQTQAPAVMPVIRVSHDDDGSYRITVDGGPASSALGRDDVASTLDALAAERGPCRVELTEADGTTYTDVVVPSAQQHLTATPAATQRSDVPDEIAGGGFLPGEDVSVAVLFTTLRASRDGSVRIRLPPALRGHLDALVLLGRTSGTYSCGDQR